MFAYLKPVVCPISCKSVIFFIFFGNLCCTVMLHVVVHPLKCAFMFAVSSVILFVISNVTGMLFCVDTTLFQTFVAHCASLHSDLWHFCTHNSDVAAAIIIVQAVFIFFDFFCYSCFASVYIILLINAYCVLLCF